jgi:glycosyltransferase involved in cell wall biosynthesis
MRILVGLAEACNIIATYAKGFRALGLMAFSVVDTVKPLYSDSHYDRVLDRLAFHSWKNRGLRRLLKRVLMAFFRMVVFIEALIRCDTFVLLFGISFLPWNLDYPILKLLRKRLVCVFLGSDVRYGPAYQVEMEMLGVGNDVQPFTKYVLGLRGVTYRTKMRTVRMAERYADLILSQPGFAQLQSRPYMRMNIPLDLSLFEFEIPRRDVPLVIHAPSNKDIKGTRFVFEAVERLRSSGVQFDFQLIEGLPNSELRNLLSRSDILVDELFSETVGTLSLEAMAAGNAVLVRYMAEYAGVPVSCPAQNVTMTTVEERLVRLVQDRNLRRGLAIEGRSFVEKHHDHVKVAHEILTWLLKLPDLEYDFEPTFWRGYHPSKETLRREKREKADFNRALLRRVVSRVWQ